MANSKIDDLLIKSENKSLSEIYQDLESYDQKTLYEFAYELIKPPYFSVDILIQILKKLYNDVPAYRELLSIFFEDVYAYNLINGSEEPVNQIFTINPVASFSMVKNMLNSGHQKGLASGILLGIIHDKIEETDDFILDGLTSESIELQRCSLVSLNHISRHEPDYPEKYKDTIKAAAYNIAYENSFHLLVSLQNLFKNNPSEFKPIIKEEIERRGGEAAFQYITRSNIQSDEELEIMKFSIDIMEKIDPKSDHIDYGLAKIYAFDKGYVIKKLEERLRERDIYDFANSYILNQIIKIDNKPLLELIESEIDEQNPKLIAFGEYLLQNCFSSVEEQLNWCDKWKNDSRTEKIILKSLGLVLTSLRNYNYDENRNKAIDLIQFFAQKNNLNYDNETRKINLKSDKTEGVENKEKTIKALFILKKLLNPPISIELEVLEENLKKAPHLCAAVGFDWLIKNATKPASKIHILNYIFADDFSEKQSYVEQVFEALYANNIQYPVQKLRDVDNARNMLTEVEIIAKLTPFFSITPEPDIEVLKPKKLDLLIESNGEKALVEIATVNERLETGLAHGCISIPGGKVKSVLLSKFRSQLQEGTKNPNVPIILLLKLADGFLSEYEVLNGIYGQLNFSWKTDTATHEVVEEGSKRNTNGFYDEDGTEFVTLIAAYKFSIYDENKFTGKLYYSLKEPTNKLSLDFILTLRKALFGLNDTSDWQSLLKIEGINEEFAQFLYSKGIDDIGRLLLIEESELLTIGLSKTQIINYKESAYRVIHALETGSIRYIKGMDQTSFELLTKKNIHLIKTLIEIQEKPDEINDAKWDIFIEDAKRILR